MSTCLDEFGPTADVVLVTFTDPSNLDWYRQTNGLEIEILVDPDRAAYAAFGLGRGSARRIWGLRAARRYVELIRDARRAGTRPHFRRPTEDTLQLGGDFVIDPDGCLGWGFWGEGPDDRPPVVALLDAVAQAGPAAG